MTSRGMSPAAFSSGVDVIAPLPLYKSLHVHCCPPQFVKDRGVSLGIFPSITSQMLSTGLRGVARNPRTFRPAFLYSCQIHDSHVASKTVTEKVADVADKVNKKVGQGLASAIEAGERATEKTKETLGSSTETAKGKSESVTQTVQEKAESAKQTGREKIGSAKKTTGEATEEMKRRANEVAGKAS